MNCIISTYLTTAKDYQRNIFQKKNEASYISGWYDSIVKLGLNGILLHDGLLDSFIRQFPLIQFIKVPNIPAGIQLYDYRWMLYPDYLNDVDNVFLTDVSDVTVINDPFVRYDGSLFCGDEPCTIRDNGWIRSSLANTRLIELPGFEDVIRSDNQLLNCGVVGGSKDIVLKFLNLMNEYLERVKFRGIDGTNDMPLFNYVMYKHFNPVHGFPVNSIFRGYEQRSDVWFIHK